MAVSRLSVYYAAILLAIAISLVRGIILNGFATKRTIAEAEEEPPE